jgi:hypothetical protein
LQLGFAPAAAVPEPEIVTLLGLGLGVLAMPSVRRRAIKRRIAGDLGGDPMLDQDAHRNGSATASNASGASSAM